MKVRFVSFFDGMALGSLVFEKVFNLEVKDFENFIVIDGDYNLKRNLTDFDSLGLEKQYERLKRVEDTYFLFSSAGFFEMGSKPKIVYENGLVNVIYSAPRNLELTKKVINCLPFFIKNDWITISNNPEILDFIKSLFPNRSDLISILEGENSPPSIIFF